MEFINFQYVSIALVFVFTSFYYLFLRKQKTSPPGPLALPIVGNIYQLPKGEAIYKQLTRWERKYGPIYQITLGFDKIIMLSDPKLIREAFSNPILNGRPNDKVFLTVADGEHGVIGSDGSVWTEQRRFTLRHLRNFGFGKNSMETHILDEAKELVENFRRQDGQAFDPCKKFKLAVLNCLWIIVTGNRFNQDDSEIEKILDNYFKELDSVFVTGSLSLFPILADIFPEWSGYNQMKKVMRKTSNFFMEIVSEHAKTREDNEPRDYIDAYLAEINQASNDPTSSFYKENGYKNLLAIIGDFFAAGAETTATTLSWSILYLAKYPKAQQKLQEEIDRVIGRSRLPSLNDRPNMPFTEALMYEILRRSSIASIGLFHRAKEDTKFEGFDISEGTFIVPNFHCVHHNPQFWENPYEFSPERFLVVDSEGTLKVQKSENLMPFSVGKRTCLGESLAKSEFFLFLTTIFQRLNIKLDQESANVTLEPQNTFISQPVPYKVVITDRK